MLESNPSSRKDSAGDSEVTFIVTSVSHFCDIPGRTRRKTPGVRGQSP